MVGRITKYPVFSFIYLLFILLVVVPVVYTVATALFDHNALNNLRQLNYNTFSLLLRSILTASSVALLSTIFGTILGFILYKTNLSFRNFYKVVLLLPLFISPYILAVAWKDFFYLLFDNVSFISSYTGVVLVLTTVFTPLSMLITGNAFSNINSQMEDAGLLITQWQKVILKITMPLIKHSLTTSFVLVFIFSISEFSVAAYFGAKVITTEIFTQFSAFYNYSLAILQSVLLMLICVAMLLVERKQISEASFLSISAKGSGSKVFQLNNFKIFAKAWLLTWLFISIIFPLAVLTFQAFKNGTAEFIKAFHLLLPTFGTSIWLALTGSLVVLVVGLTAAFYSEVVKQRSMDSFLLIVFAIPSTILGISLIKFYNHPNLNFIYSGFAIIIIGYVGKFSFISSKIIGNSIKQIPSSFDEAAQMEGIPFTSRFLKILMPLIMPSVFISFIVSFIFCLGELGTTIMIYPPGSELMPLKVFTIMANASQQLTSSMTLIVFGITLLLITAFYFAAKPWMKKYNYANN